MRRKKNRSRLLPFGAGLAAGCPSDHRRCGGGSAGDVADRRGQFHGVADGGSGGGAWELPLRQDCGKQRRRGGLKTGAVCGVLYCVPLILAALIFGTVQGILLPVKAALCIGFAAAGGVSGVNSPEK